MVRLAEKLTQLLAWVSGLVILLMMIHVMIDVLGKYLFNAPLPGTAEVVAAYYMIGAVFLPLAYVEAAGGSIVVEVIYEKVSPRAQKVYAGRRRYHFGDLLQCAGLVLLGSCGPRLEGQRNRGRHLAHHDLASEVLAAVRLLPRCRRHTDARAQGRARSRDRS